ncbi:DUF2057 family protein [Vibrio barjaei]|jgi:uncharacterized protein YccT (UPF0319 family)|uniref:UPF0319 protein ACGRH2_21005 n=1 Tax=Vibrio barjaei TaxID=1676683 RepID=A0ABW7IQT2_9VIBR|nr:DUF2057 family protein [Vibrio barjaei]MCY9872452.1 DUF2057 family protein [Vibrio barjaei]OIN27478.1 hypothetical protein AWH66_2012330 [Vibrio barjaei]
MKASKILACALLAGCSTMAVADVTIKIPDSVDLLSVNAGDPETKSNGFFSSGKTATLPDGVNQIVFRFEPLFDLNREERVTVPSKAIIARFDASNTELTLEVPSYQNERQAKKDIDSFQWSLVDANGNAIPVTQDKLIKDGMQIGRDYNREAEDYNRKGGVAAIAAAGAVAAVTLPATLPADPANAEIAVPGGAADNTAEEMLIFWYNKADADTKARFKEYISSN